MSGHVRVCVCTSNKQLNNSVLFKSDTNTQKLETSRCAF